jgi:hypothetical protein
VQHTLIDHRSKDSGVADQLVRQEVLALILKETPFALWRSTMTRMTWAYSEAFASVAKNPLILAAQKPAKLLDDRFYLAETALHESAKDSGIISSGQKIEINGWVYTLVRSGGICLMQAYIQSPLDFARRARFREQHAALNDFLSRPQFAFGDVPPSLFDVSQIAGIIVHGPKSKVFDEKEQRLGFLNLCVPSEDYRRWELNIPVAEIMSLCANDGETSFTREFRVGGVGEP